MIKFDKLVEILKSKKKMDEIKENSKEELAEKFGDEFSAMKDYDQNSPYHDRDLLTHTIDVVNNVFDKQNKDKDNLLAAAFFHDIGKPLVCSLKYKDKPDDENNWHVYHGHAEKSAEITAKILEDMHLEDEKQKEKILFYILNHDKFLSVKSTEESVMKFIEDETKKRLNDGKIFIPGFEEYKNLVALCKADDEAKKDEIIINGAVVDTKEKKLERLKDIIDIIRENKFRIENLFPKAEMNRSLICVPFRFETYDDPVKSKEVKNRIMAVLNDPDLMDNMSESKNKILGFVARRFDCDVKKSSVEWPSEDAVVCTARKIKETSLKKITGDYQFVVKECAENPFSIKNLYLFCFKTGINILVEEIEFSETDYDKISDNLFFLKDSGTGLNKIGNHYSNVIKCISGEESVTANEHAEEKTRREFHISLTKKIFKDLKFNIIEANSSSEKLQYINILSYFSCTEAYYKIHEKDLLFRLSHCYKKDIEYVKDTDDIFDKYVNNNNGIWGITSFSNAFIAFKNKHESSLFEQFTRGYLLSYVLLLNQKYTIYGFLEKIPADLQNAENAKKIRKDLYSFEMDCNFKTVSELPQYQNVYSKTYEAFNIHSLISDVQEPLEAYDLILKESEKYEAEKEKEKTEEREKKREKSLNIISILAVSSALVDLWDLVGRYFDEMYNLDCLNPFKKILQLILCFVVFVYWIKKISPFIEDHIEKRRENKMQKGKNNEKS